MRTAKAIMQRNLQVGRFAPLVITAEMGKGAIRRAQDELHLSRISLAGADATPEQLQALIDAPALPDPTEAERAAEYEAFTGGDVKTEHEESFDELVARITSPTGIERSLRYAEEQSKAWNDPHEVEMRRLYAEQERHQAEAERAEDSARKARG